MSLARTLLTTTRTAQRFSSAAAAAASSPIASPIAQRQTTARLYQPIFRSNTFVTMTGTEGKKGVHNLESKADFDKALGEPGVMVLDCFATWCGPCKVISPQVVKFSNQYPNARYYKLDVDEVPDVAQELGIRAMPTFVIFENGTKVSEVVGANPKALEAAIQKYHREEKKENAPVGIAAEKQEEKVAA